MGRGKQSSLDAASIPINQGAPKPLSEIRADLSQGIDTLEGVDGFTDRQYQTLMEDEAFMNEIVMIRIHTTTDDNAPKMAMPQVNGVNQPIFRGVPTPVRRKYVEALARAKETKYSQSVPNPAEPDKINMVPTTSLAFPFEVIEDRNPRGRPWLERILKEAA